MIVVRKNVLTLCLLAGLTTSAFATVDPDTVRNTGVCSNGLPCGTAEMGIFKSVDGGKSFVMDTNGVPGDSEIDREYLTAIPKKGERRKYLTVSSGNHSTYFGRLATSIDLVIIDSVQNKNMDTTLLYIRVIDSTIDSSWGNGQSSKRISHYDSTMVVSIAGFQDISRGFSGIPSGLFGRFLIDLAPKAFCTDTVFKGKDAFRWNSYQFLNTFSELVADSIGFVSYNYVAADVGLYHSISITLLDDTANPNATLPNAPATLRKSSGISFAKSFGRFPRQNAFTLNGRKGSWCTGAYGMVIEKNVSGVNKNKNQ